MSFTQNNDIPGASPATPGRQNTYKEAESVPFGNGYFRVAPKWITDRFNDHWSNGKNTGQAYCSVAGILCHGPIDKVRAVYAGGEAVGLFDVTRPSDPADPNYYCFSAEFGGIDKELMSATHRFTIYWGREDQPADAWLQATTGQQHPPYRGQALVIFQRIHCGQIQANSQSRPPLPNIEFSVIRLVSPSVPSGLRLPASVGASQFRGVNLISGLWDILTHQRGGLGLGADFLDQADWLAKAVALEIGSKPAAGLYGDGAYVSPLLTGGTEAEKILTDGLSYIDGMLAMVDGKLRIDWYPNNGTVPSELPELSQHDLVEPPQIKTSSLCESPSVIVVDCVDGDGFPFDLTEAAETATVPFVREISGDTVVQKLGRPWFTSRSIASAYAARYASTSTVPEMSGDLAVRLDKAVRVDGSPLRAGDIFRLNWTPAGLLVVARITERLEEDSIVRLRWVRERGMAALPYTPASDPRQSYVLPDPVVLGADDWTIVEAPDGLSSDPAVICLPRRSSAALVGVRLWFDEDGDWATGASLLGSQGYAARLTLSSSISDSVASLTAAGTDIDVSAVLGSGVTHSEQTDDTLLALIGSEWVSLGSVVSVGAGTYSIAIERGRLLSSPATHDAGALIWVTRRDRITLWTQAVFSPEATRYFKIQTYHAVSDSAMSAAKGLTLRDRTPVAPGGVSIKVGTGKLLQLSWSAVVTVGGPTSYQIWRSGTNASASASKIAQVTANIFHDADVAFGSTYWYWLKSVDASGRVSDFSSVASASPAYVPAMPSSGNLIQNGGGEDGVAGWFEDVASGAAQFKSGSRALFTHSWMTSHAFPVVPGQTYSVRWWRYRTATHSSSTYTMILSCATSPAAGFVGNAEYQTIDYVHWEVVGGGAWELVEATWTCPANRYWASIRFQHPYDGANTYHVDGVEIARIVTDADVAKVAPSQPADLAYVSESAYTSGDGTVLSSITLTIPAMPAGAAQMGLLYTTSTSLEWKLAALVTYTAAQNLTVDDLTPGVTYYFILRAWSFAGASSPYSNTLTRQAPNKATSSSIPTNIGANVPAYSVALPSSWEWPGLTLATTIAWTDPTDKDFVATEWTLAYPLSPPSESTSGKLVPRGVQKVDYYFGFVSPSWCMIFVRTIDRSGNKSAWTSTGVYASDHCRSVTAAMANQLSTAVVVSGVQTGADGASSVQKVLCRYPLTAILTTTGGSPSEAHSVNIANRGFNTAPDTCAVSFGSSNANMTVWYDKVGSTSTSAVLVMATLDGSNLPAGYGYRLSLVFEEYD
jgi:hypothetical protein